MRRATLWGLALVAVLLAVEGVLQLTIGRTVVQDRWFEGRIHVPDAELGFRFAPGYRGAMRHPDGVFYEPLALDSLGFRRTPAGPAGAPDVVFIGGASNVLSYGLPDSLTIPALVAGAVGRPVRVHNTAWPGFEWRRNWTAYRRLLRPHVRPSVVVLSLPYAPAQVGGWDAQPDPVGDLFRYDRGMVVPPGGAVLSRLGRWGRRSLLLYRLGRAGDAVAEALARRTAAGRAEGRPDPAALGRRRIEADLAALTDSIRADGAAVVFVTLPNRAAESPDLYAGLAVPEGVPWVDLHRALRPRMQGHWIARGHYGETAARWIAERIAPVVARAVGEVSGADEPGRDVEAPPEDR